MATIGTTYFGEIANVLLDVQAEFVLLGLAIATNLLFFSKFNLFGSKAKKVVDENPTKRRSKFYATPNSGLGSLKAAIKAGDAKAAMARFEEIHTSGPHTGSSAHADQLVKLAANSGSLSELLALFSKLGLLSSTLEFILTESAEKGDAGMLKEAQELGRSQGIKFTAGVYQALLKGAIACGTQREAEQFMSEAQRNDAANMATYNVFLLAQLKWCKGRLSKVHEVLESMVKAGFKPNAATFNKLMDEAITSNVVDVWNIINEMKAFRTKPDQVTCRLLLKGWSPNSKKITLDKIMDVLEDVDILEGEMGERLFSFVVDAAGRLGRADLVKRLLKKQQNSRISTIKHAHTYGSVIRAYGYVEDVKGARDTWNAMKKQQVVPINVTLGCMVEALVTNGDVEGGYKVLQEVRQDEKTASLVNAIMYGSVLKGFSHNQRFDRVWQVYEEMVSQKLEFSMTTYNALIDTCAQSGELARIPALLKGIQAQGLKMCIITYSTIIKAYCKQNLLDKAFDLFDEVEKSGEFQPDEIMYNTLLDGCARQAVYERGMELFERMKQSGVRPTNFTLSVLVKLANRGKKIEVAFSLCDELSTKYGFRLSIHVFNNLMQTCINHNDLPRAIGVFERMLQERVRPDAHIYRVLLRACVEKHARTEAASLLRAGMGLKEPHPQLAKYGTDFIQPQGGLPGDLISEILWGITDTRNPTNERIAASLLLELSTFRNLKLDPKLRLKLASHMSAMS